MSVLTRAGVVNATHLPAFAERFQMPLDGFLVRVERQRAVIDVSGLFDVPQETMSPRAFNKLVSGWRMVIAFSR